MTDPSPEQPPPTQTAATTSESSLGPNAQRDSDTSKPSGTAIFGAVLSVVALLLSGFTFYWSSAWPAVIKITAGDAIYISYGPDGNLGIIVPLVYSNQGSLPAVVNHVRLVCRKQDAKDATPLYAIYYVKIDKSENEMDSFVVPERIKGGEQIARLILFWSGADRIKTDDFSVGDYACGVTASYDGNPARDVTRLSFPVRQEDIDQLKSHGPSKTNRFIFSHESGVTEIVLRKPY